MKINSLLIIDVLGAAAAALCAGLGLWFGVLNVEATSQRITEYTDQVAKLEERLGDIQSFILEQERTLQDRKETFGARDLLPTAAPVERELRAVSDLARRHGLELTGLTPMGTWDYPGVRELRYRMTADGSFAAYLRFLRDFEIEPSWSDITYLKIDSSKAKSADTAASEVIISLYAAVDELPEPEAT